MFDEAAYSELQKLAKYKKKRKLRLFRIFAAVVFLGFASYAVYLSQVEGRGFWIVVLVFTAVFILTVRSALKIPKPWQCYYAEIVDISEHQKRLYNQYNRMEIMTPPVYQIRHRDESVITEEHTDWGQDITAYTDFVGYGERYKIGEKVIFFEEPGIGRCIVPREKE